MQAETLTATLRQKSVLRGLYKIPGKSNGCNDVKSLFYLRIVSPVIPNLLKKRRFF